MKGNNHGDYWKEWNQNVRGKQLINDKQSGGCMELVEKCDVSDAMYA